MAIFRTTDEYGICMDCLFRIAREAELRGVLPGEETGEHVISDQDTDEIHDRDELQRVHALTENMIRRYQHIPEMFESEPMKKMGSFTPASLKDILDKHVIGQEEAKKAISVAIYNHYKRIRSTDMRAEKSNILLIGPSGSGKTLIAKTLADTLDIPFAIADATTLTEAGYVGQDVENVLVKLLRAAKGDVARAEKGIVFIDEIDKISRLGENRSITRDVSGEGVQQALLKIIEGDRVSIPANGGRRHPSDSGIEIDTRNILFICGGAFDGLEKIMNSRNTKSRSIGFGASVDVNEDKDMDNKVTTDDLVRYGMTPELLGRLPVKVMLKALTEEDLVHVLTDPDNSITNQYIELMAEDGIDLQFDKEALEAIAQAAIRQGSGARGLRSILEDVMMDIMFELPSEADVFGCRITKETVEGGKPVLIREDAG